MGDSWGSIVGLAVAVERPDLLYAYGGVGQGIDSREGEKAGMAWTRAKAQAAGDKEAVAAIDALAPYQQGEFTIDKIGRASCRERVCQYVSISVVADLLKKKQI